MKVRRKDLWVAYAIMWMSVSLAVCTGMYITKSAWCLWAMVIPAMVKVSRKTDDSKHNKSETYEDKE